MGSKLGSKYRKITLLKIKQLFLFKNKFLIYEQIQNIE